MTTPRSARRSATPPTAVASPLEVRDPLRWVWLGLVSGLFFVRWWQPTEGTALGHTLPIVEGWFIALSLAGWLGLRGTKWQIPWDGLQWAVCLLAGGHLVSGFIVMGTSGDRRAAVNLMWEWTALLVAFPLLRWALSVPQARREWTVVALAGALTLGCYGLTQRFVFYPQMVSQYERLRNELDKLEETAAAGGFADLQRMQRLRSEMIGNGLSPNMLSGSGRALLEGRLKHSSEPLGLFALANTFAGFLLVWWAILVFHTVQFWTRKPVDSGKETSPASAYRRRILTIAILVLAVSVMGYCLLLTKSRTAYVGAAVSLLVWTVASLWKWSIPRRQLVVWGAVAIAGLGSLALVAGLTGGLDQLVLAEAPKSLQYRMEYWWGSLQVIRESPLTGVGPGQFRQHYLAHKLPRSSEEIADPHNLVLDVWGNGGLLALAGLAWIVVGLSRSSWPAWQTQAATEVEARDSAQVPTVAAIPLNGSVQESGVAPRPARKIPQPGALTRNGTLEPGITIVEMSGWSSPIRWGGLLGLLSLWLVGGGLETSLLAFLAVWAVAILVFDAILPVTTIRSLNWAAAGVGLVIHLTGAGGIGMPAITQLLLLMAILAAGERPVGRELNLYQYQLGNWTILAGGLVLFAGGFWTAARPVGRVQTLLTNADYAKLPSQREQLYRQATLADPWAAEPWERLAEVSFAKWRSAADPDEADLKQAFAAEYEALKRNPASFHTHRTLGMMYSARAEKSGTREDYAAAVREMQSALERYPYNAELLQDAADVFRSAGEIKLAAAMARRAVDQDDINHAAGHADKWLTTESRQRMERLSQDR